MRGIQKTSARFEDTGYWSRSFQGRNPEYVPNIDVYQSSDFPHVFLGGADDLDEAEQMAGQKMCQIVDCRDLPEIGDNDQHSWDFPFYTTVKHKFDNKVEQVVNLIQTSDCPVFVHCALGANRSVSVLAAALSILTGKSLDSVLTEMKNARSFVNPQDPYYLMALEQSPYESPDFKEQRFQELDQDFPLEPDFARTAQNWLQRACNTQNLPREDEELSEAQRAGKRQIEADHNITVADENIS